MATARYVPYAPTPGTTISNSEAPSGWYLIAVNVDEEVPDPQDIPYFAGILRPVGLPAVSYQLTYFTMDSIATAPTIEYCKNNPALTLTYCSTTDLDNAYMVGGALRIGQEEGGNNGILTTTLIQNIMVLSQRKHYT